MTQEQATILITEAFWALKERPNIDVQRVTYEGGAIDQRALGVNRVKIFERWKAIDTRDKREKFTALVPAIMELPLDDEKSVHERVDNARIDLRSKYYVKPKADHPWLTRRTQSHQTKLSPEVT
ncbi:hypothetical protein EN35_11805 [Rhodococcus qingshengii]|nr:hypothetical protein EN35_11805 [Rhodococcus qingshengii]